MCNWNNEIEFWFINILIDGLRYQYVKCEKTKYQLYWVYTDYLLFNSTTGHLGRHRHN